MDMNERFIQKIKERNLKVCPQYLDYKHDILASHNWFNKRIFLTKNQSIKLSDEVFDLTEPLFNPKLFGMDGKGIGEKIYNCVRVS